MDTMNQTLAYLKSSKKKGIMFYKHRHLDIMSCIESDFATFKKNKESILGCLIFIKGKLVAQSNKKQNVVSLFSKKLNTTLHHAIT